MKPQNALLLALLKQGFTTPLDAWTKAGVYNFSARLTELKREGFELVGEWVIVGKKKFKQYKIKGTK